MGRAVRTLPGGQRAGWRFAVPLALALILFLLWLASGSVRSALIIFLNVPFAMAGGAVALWARSIPFSISAGIGFIALFGVAVLNGLVLISFARHLEEKGLSHIDAVREAAEERLRPVLMTALVAALGFIPMAVSSEPGSEVQRHWQRSSSVGSSAPRCSPCSSCRWFTAGWGGPHSTLEATYRRSPMEPDGRRDSEAHAGHGQRHLPLVGAVLKRAPRLRRWSVGRPPASGGNGHDGSCAERNGVR